MTNCVRNKDCVCPSSTPNLPARLRQEYRQLHPKMSGVSPFTAQNRSRVASLYKRSLKLARDWHVHREPWRRECLIIRDRFEQNKLVTSPRQLQALLDQTHQVLEAWKHPDPYIVPTAPGGSKVSFYPFPA